MFFLTWNLKGQETARARLLQFLRYHSEQGYVVATEWSPPKVKVEERNIIEEEIQSLTDNRYVLAAKATENGRTILIGPKPPAGWDYDQREDRRIISASMPIVGGTRSFRLVGIHSLDRRNHSPGPDRWHKIEQIAKKLNKKHLGPTHNPTAVVMGDFNAAPYDSDLYHESCFSARREVELFQTGKSASKGLYNPTWSLLRDTASLINGTYRGTYGGFGPWWIVDQILFGPEIARGWRHDWNPNYCTELCGGSKPNSRKKRPEAHGSDHFPIWTTFKPEEMFQ